MVDFEDYRFNRRIAFYQNSYRDVVSGDSSIFWGGDAGGGGKKENLLQLWAWRLLDGCASLAVGGGKKDGEVTGGEKIFKKGINNGCVDRESNPGLADGNGQFYH